MMISSSIRSVLASSVISILSEPTHGLGWRSFTSLFIVAGAARLLRPGGRRLRLAHPDPLRAIAALALPAIDGVAELEEGDDPGWDREPEGDHAVGEDGGEHVRARNPEEHEGADQAGVDRADTPRRERDEVGEGAEEEPLDHHPERHRDIKGVEARPEDRDVRSPEPDRPAERQHPRARVANEIDSRAGPLRKGRRRRR